MAEMRTQQNAGKHHLGDFIPVAELQKFQQGTDGTRKGIPVDKSDYQNNKLMEDNKG